MSEHNRVLDDWAEEFGVDADEIRNQANNVRLDDDTAVQLALMDAATPGSTSKRSLVCEAVNKYYKAYFSRIDTEELVSENREDSVYPE